MLNSTIDNTLEFGTDEPELAVRAVPNPARASLTLELPQGLSVVRVFTLSGAEVFRAAGVDGMKVATADWPAGTYLIDVRHADGRQFRERIQVAH